MVDFAPDPQDDTDPEASGVEHMSEEEQQRLGLVSLEEDPLPVPTSVTRQQLVDAVKALGLDPDKTTHIQLGVKHISVMVMIDGTKYPRGLMDAGILVPGTMVEIPVKDDDVA